jgi:hypothetical protein
VATICNDGFVGCRWYRRHAITYQAIVQLPGRRTGSTAAAFHGMSAW